MSALTSSMHESWSGVSLYGKASSSSRCQTVSGREGVTAARHARGVQPDQLAGDLRAPPCGRAPWSWSSRHRRAGAGSAPRRRRSASPGRAGRWARRAGRRAGRACAGAYSTTRYSRVAPATVRCTISTYRPTPCCSCTTKSPGLSCSGSMVWRRRVGMRRVSRVVDFWPTRSVSVSTASRSDGARNPWSRAPVTTVTRPGSGTSSSDSATRTARPSPRTDSAMRSAVPWPSVTRTTAQPCAEQVARLGEGARGLAAIAVGGAHVEHHAVDRVGVERLDVVGRDVGAERRRAPPRHAALKCRVRGRRPPTGTPRCAGRSA